MSSMPTDISLPSMSPEGMELSKDRSFTTSPIESDLSSTNYEGVSKNNGRRYYYLTPNAVKKLPEFQYNGADLSLLYKYVLSPLAAWCVDNLTPQTVAPNTITLFGLCWMVTSYMVILAYCPGLYEANTDIVDNYYVPRVIFLLNGCAMLIYQTLDNMDGKQARKTGSSSPLGLLFDHGCDAMNSILGSANWIAAMAMVPGNVNLLPGGSNYSDNIQHKSLLSEVFGGDAILAALLILLPMLAFYISTWEQFYTGKLVLPPFNGPSEGLLMGASLSIISFFWGPMYWQTTSLADLVIAKLGDNVSFLTFLEGRVRNMDMIVFASIFGLVQEVVLKTIFVVRKYGLQTLRTVSPNMILLVSTLAMVHYDPTILLRRPRIMMHLTSGLFTEMTTQIMLDHMVEEDFEVRKRWCLIPQVLLALWTMSGVSYSVEMFDSILLVYTTGIWVYLAFKIRVQIYEICDVLGIYCFDIVSPHPKRNIEVETVDTTLPVPEAVKKTN